MENTADVIVAGLGAMGSAALYQLAKSGARVIGIDRYRPPHNLGSSHGNSRITRQAIGEGITYTPLALRSHEIWHEIEAETGKKLLTITGGLFVGAADTTGARKKNFVDTAIEGAQKFNIPHTPLDEKQLAERFPLFRFKPGEHGMLEHNAGFLKPELCVDTQLALAQKLGAVTKFDERVMKFEPQNDGTVSVTTDKGKYSAAKLLVSAGPWMPEMFPRYAKLLTVSREVMYWFDLTGPIERYEPQNFPVFIYSPGVYGFPAMDGPGGGLKIAAESFTTTSPETTDRQVSEKETNEMFERHAHPLIPGFKRNCVRAVACIYTTTPDSDFIIDTLPEAPQVIVASPCSGHGFKHSAAIGEILMQLTRQGKSALNIDAFKLSRFVI